LEVPLKKNILLHFCFHPRDVFERENDGLAVQGAADFQAFDLSRSNWSPQGLQPKSEPPDSIIDNLA
jgi:hypothetical protein